MSQQLKGAIITMAIGFMFVIFEFILKIRTSLAGIFILGMGAGLLLGDRLGKKQAGPTNPMQPL
ncbi:MAG TPA: hypothetical protein VGJ96_09985 [Gemmatimonadaceae bacterium]